MVEYVYDVWGNCSIKSSTSNYDLAPKNVNGLNLYCYCSNDPVNFVDPSGHDIVMIIGLIGCFGVVIVLVSVATGVAVSEILKGSEEKRKWRKRR